MQYISYYKHAAYMHYHIHMINYDAYIDVNTYIYTYIYTIYVAMFAHQPQEI